MKYTKEQLEAMSDLQINEIISDLQGMWVQTEFGENIGLTLSFRERYPSTVWARSKDDLSGWEQFNYCLSPEDMMPLAFEVGISLVKVSDGYVAFGDDYGYLDNQGTDLSIDSTDDSLSWSNEAAGHERPLRACAIVYILINQ